VSRRQRQMCIRDRTERAQGVTQETLREVKVGLGVPVFC
ncbi:tryptophan--tRNA ligase, partial [Enterobacter cloacae complex sp.6730552]